jgi:uncharacterized DUF497 family protein
MDRMKLIFEWDEVKAIANIKKHKVSFEEGKTVFNDPFLLSFPDSDNTSVRGAVYQCWSFCQGSRSGFDSY